MKNYNFNKAKELIKQNSENLISADLGMLEDWSWTAECIYENGEYKRELPENADELNLEYMQLRESGVSLFDPQIDKYTEILICGIYGSDWATPCLKLYFKDDFEKTINCYTEVD